MESAWLERSISQPADCDRVLAVVAVDGDGRHGLGDGDHRHVDGARHPLGRAVAGACLRGRDRGLGDEVHVGSGDARGVGGQNDRPVHLGQLGQALGRVLGVQQEPTRADRQDGRPVTDEDQRAVFGLQYPVQALAELGARRNHRQRVVQRLAAAGAVGHPGIVPGAPRAPVSGSEQAEGLGQRAHPMHPQAGRGRGRRPRHGGRHQRPCEARPMGLGQAAVGARDGAHLAGKSQLPEDDDIGGHGGVGDDRRHGQRDGEVGRRLGDGDAAHGGGEHLGRGRDVDRRAAGQDGQQQVGPCRVDPQCLRSRRACAAPVARSEQRLHFDQQRPPALQDRHDDAAGDAGHAVAEEERAGIGHGAEAVVAHLEDADLAGRPEAVLDRRQHAQGVVTVAVEGEHRVDQMLDGARPGQIAVLGHVADQEQRGPGRLGHAGQALDAGAHLGQAAGGLAQLGVRDGLQRVDHDQRGAMPLHGGLDGLDVGSLDGQEVPGHQADARGPPPNLRQGLLGRGEHDVEPRGGQRREHLEEQRRLADAGGPEEERDRAGHHAAAHDAVQLADPRRQRVHGVGRDVGQRQRWRPFRRCRSGAGTAHRSRTEGVPLAAGRAPSRPAQRGRSAGRAEKCAFAARARARSRGHGVTISERCHKTGDRHADGTATAMAGSVRGATDDRQYP